MFLVDGIESQADRSGDASTADGPPWSVEPPDALHQPCPPGRARGPAVVRCQHAEDMGRRQRNSAPPGKLQQRVLAWLDSRP